MNVKRDIRMASSASSNMARSSTSAGSRLCREMKSSALSTSSVTTVRLTVGQTSSRFDTHFGQMEAEPTSINIRDKNGHRRYITIAYALAIDKNESVRLDAEVSFKIPGLSRVEWINAQGKAWPLPFYAAFGLLAAPPLGKRCRRCASEHGRDDNCVFGQKKGEHGGTAECMYPFCDKKRNMRYASAVR
jgi:hypothetical protein